MAIIDPQSGAILGSDHLKVHDVIRADDSAPDQSFWVDSSGNIHVQANKGFYGYTDASNELNLASVDPSNEINYGDDSVDVNIRAANEVNILSDLNLNGNELQNATGNISQFTNDSSYELQSNKGLAGGYASLDGGGKVPSAQLPSAIMEYKGTWNANTNTPSLSDGTGDTGDVYRVSVAGSQDLGSGSISFEVGDYCIYNGSTWEKSDTTDAVASVNGYTGVVSLDHSDLNNIDGSTYHVTSAVYNALTDANAQLSALHTDGTPTFDGLTIDDNSPYIDLRYSGTSRGYIQPRLDTNDIWMYSKGGWGIKLCPNDSDAYAIAFDTSANMTFPGGAYVAIDKIRAIDDDGLYLVDDDDNGIFVKDGGNTGFGITSPDTIIHAYSDDSNTILKIESDYVHNTGSASLYLDGGGVSTNNKACQIAMYRMGDFAGRIELIPTDLTTGSESYRMDIGTTVGGSFSEAISILSGNIGIGTTSPGKILDCNSGSGNMIADGYDTHSLSCYKEEIYDVSKALEKVQSMRIREWKRKPFISADEIKEATIEQFGEKEWEKYFPEEDSHRNKSLLNMPECEMKAWIDDWCEQKRVTMRQEPRYQKKKYGLVAEEAPDECKAYNDNDELCGVNLENEIGLALRAIQELSEENDALKQRVSKLEQIRSRNNSKEKQLS